MIYCLNPRCPRPENDASHRFCITCGSVLSLGDRYRAESPLGERGISQTFLGIDTATSPPGRCILKQIRLASPETFEQVVSVFETLGRHPQIPQLLAAFATEPRIAHFRPTLIQEWVTGTPVTEQSWDETAIRDLLNGLLPLLSWVHRKGILHRDINPNNILCNGSGQWVLVDFSLAKVTRKATEAATGTVVGSAAYTAPEQLRGKAIPASDLYSLAWVCIHLLTQLPPLDLLGSLGGIAHWADYLETPVSPELRRFLTRMGSEIARDRFPDAAAAYAALNQGQAMPAIASTTTATVAQPTWHCALTLKEHPSPVHALAFHRQQPLLASAGSDRTIRQWLGDFEARAREARSVPLHSNTATLTGHRSLITALDYHPLDDTLLSGSWDYTIRRWQAGQEIARYEGHTGWVTTLCHFPDGRAFASGSADKTIALWDLASGQRQALLSGHQGAVYTIAIAPDGSYLASGGADATVILWQGQTGEILRVLRGHRDTVNALCFSATGQFLFSGDSAGRIGIWQLSKGRLRTMIPAHREAINSLQLLGTGSLLVSGSSDSEIKLWHPATGKRLHTLLGHRAEVFAIACHPRKKLFASASQDMTIKIWRFGVPTAE